MAHRGKCPPCDISPNKKINSLCSIFSRISGFSDSIRQIFRASRGSGPALHPVQTIVHVPGDNGHAVLVGGGQLPADLLGVHVPQADDLVVDPGVLGHLVIVGGQQGDGIDVV